MSRQTKPLVQRFLYRFCFNVWVGFVVGQTIGAYILPPDFSTSIWRVIGCCAIERTSKHEISARRLTTSLLIWRSGTSGPTIRRILLSRNFFCRCMKRLIYQSPVEAEYDLLSRLVVAAQLIEEAPGVMEPLILPDVVGRRHTEPKL